MTKILFIRHGQSLANAAKVFAGHYNIDLSELGKKQAECTADFVVKNYSVDAVYSSDLMRAYKTAKAVADRLGLTVITDEGMREIYAGDWEAKEWEPLVETSEDFRHWRADIGTSCPTNGESVAKLYERVYKTVCKIAEQNDGKTIVIATHATPIRVLEQRISGRPMSHMKNISWVTNASVSEIDYENGRLYAVKICQDEHLANCMSALPANV